MTEPVTPDDARIARLEELIRETVRQRSSLSVGVKEDIVVAVSAEVPWLIERAKRADQAEAELRRTREERDAARGAAETFRNSMYAVESACNEQDARATTAEAAVARLERENAALREGLAPFAQEAALWNGFDTKEEKIDAEPLMGNYNELCVGDLRRAAHLLSADPAPPDASP